MPRLPLSLLRLPVVACVLAGPLAMAQQHDHHDSGMRMDAHGMVMNENRDRLPSGCEAVSGDLAFEIEAGVEYASGHPGDAFGYSRSRLAAEACSRITVTFRNRDAVRHQWMVHGLPRYLYPGGMFHLEAAGGATQSGTFIVPGDDATYLVHCDVAQHMEKGMKAELVVGAGGRDLWAVPGVSAPFNRADYLADSWPIWVAGAALTGLALGGVLGVAGRRRRRGGRDRK